MDFTNTDFIIRTAEIKDTFNNLSALLPVVLGSHTERRFS